MYVRTGTTLKKVDGWNRTSSETKTSGKEIPLVHYHVTAVSVRDFGDSSSDRENQPEGIQITTILTFNASPHAAGQADLACLCAEDACCARLRISDRINGNATALPECILAAGSRVCG